MVLSHSEITSRALGGTMAEESVAVGDSARGRMMLVAVREVLIETT